MRASIGVGEGGSRNADDVDVIKSNEMHLTPVEVFPGNASVQGFSPCKKSFSY